MRIFRGRFTKDLTNGGSVPARVAMKAEDGAAFLATGATRLKNTHTKLGGGGWMLWALWWRVEDKERAKGQDLQSIVEVAMVRGEDG